ncbi:hypothetical protein WICANDRAFT_76177 [Wickerhamomyces anomalus NRRL Y-366-8]|uniref:Autophagy-related protein 14 n=1 Tax=Wickerhamomyces anomalus (strain ATCC 58044 / CBS 1984 / NCYC 433 / NRRL Y-366-8) TaxID=683960 RepID=A0A1E3PAU8_WICAA|nr:uncharacterized protein WICANDRAFT_76177 [Wickerhamomyces anomalus NRRL Y-366-8]ODQ61997.1 hypothetical protein WICANDRAFT_76177 [Wickerhamomyces anomalus NRRL Y-366-8]
MSIRYDSTERRLRHVTGIYLRNLSTDSSIDGQQRRKSSTTTPTTPTKASRNTKEQIIGFETPLERQLHLQKLNNEKFLNVFCSLHFLNDKDENQCFYVSEVRDRSLNADFQEFSLSSLKNSKDQQFTLKVWSSNYRNPDSWKLLIDIDARLPNLLYINKTMDLINIDTKNSIFISLYDGVYLLPNEEFNLNEYLHLASNSTQLGNESKLKVVSFTYDLVLKLSKQIEETLEDSQSIDTFKIEKIKAAIEKQKELNKQRRQKLEELKKEKAKKLKEIEKRQSRSTISSEEFIKMKEEFSSSLIKHENVLQELLIERAKVTKIVAKIFPRDDIREWLNVRDFEILPEQLSQNELTKLINTNDKVVIEQINASFGYLCQIVYLLSHYLAIPLKYQVQPFGSTSYIIDKINFSMGSCY